MAGLHANQLFSCSVVFTITTNNLLKPGSTPGAVINAEDDTMTKKEKYNEVKDEN